MNKWSADDVRNMKYFFFDQYVKNMKYSCQDMKLNLACTGHVRTRAIDIYSNSFKTTCFTWIMVFVITCIFIIVVLLIRVI